MNDVPRGVLRLVHRNTRNAYPERCEVLVDGEVVATLASSGYRLTADLNGAGGGVPQLAVLFPVVGPLGDICTIEPVAACGSSKDLLEPGS